MEGVIDMKKSLQNWYASLSIRSLTSVLSLAALVLFQIVFAAAALVQTPLAHFKQYQLVDTVRLYHTASADMARPLLLRMALLILAQLLLYCFLSASMDTSPMPILTPVGILLTISLVFQTYINAPSASRKHFLLILMGLNVLWAGALLAKLLSRQALTKNRLKQLLWGMLALCLVNLLLGLLHPVNGSGAFVSLLGANFQPGELFKLLVILYVGMAFVPLREDPSLRRLFLLSMGAMLATLVLVRDLGNAAILFAMLLTVLYMLYGIPAALLTLLCGGVGAVLGYGILFACSPNSYIVKRISDTFVALANPEANANLRRALLSVVRSGLLGRGLDNSLYATNNYAANCDFCFDTILAVFGAGTALLIVGSYAVLVLGCRVRLGETGQDMAYYTFGNLMMTLISTQAIIHIACNCNLLPLTGVCLPLISTGGSNLLCSLFCTGLAVGCRISDAFAHRLGELCKGLLASINPQDAAESNPFQGREFHV